MNEITKLPLEPVFIRHFSNELQLRQEFILFFVLEGSMQITIYEKSYELHPHDIIFINSYEVHSVSNTSPDIHVMALFLQPDYINSACPDLHTILFSQHLIPYSETDELYINLCKSLADIIFNTIQSDSTSQLTIFSAGYHILTQLIHHLGIRQNTNQTKTDYTQHQISQILNYLNKNYAENITLASAAAILNFHPQYFSVFFKKHFQINFVNYLNILRINKSLTALTNTDMSITELPFLMVFPVTIPIVLLFAKYMASVPVLIEKNVHYPTKMQPPLLPTLIIFLFSKNIRDYPTVLS